MLNILVIEEDEALCDYIKKSYSETLINKNFEEYTLAIVNSDLSYYPFEIRTDCLLISEEINVKSVPIFAKQIISCGMSASSTACFSSIDEKKAVLCLQREIRTLSGKTILPTELPCVYDSGLSVAENIIKNVARLYIG